MFLFHRQMLQPWRHVDRLDVRVLAVFRRAHLNAQVAAGTVFRCYLQDVFLAAHISRLHIQRLQRGRGVLHGLRLHHFGANGGVRAGGNAVVALGAQVRLPDWDRFGDIAFLPLGGAHRPGAVRREGRYRQCITQSGQHRGSDGFDKVGGSIGNHRRTHRTAVVNRLQRDLNQRL